jgi:hypothetical protein
MWPNFASRFKTSKAQGLRAACARSSDLHPGWLQLLEIELYGQTRSWWYVKDRFIQEDFGIIILGLITHGGTVPPYVVPAINNTDANNQRNG